MTCGGRDFAFSVVTNITIEIIERNRYVECNSITNLKKKSTERYNLLLKEKNELTLELTEMNMNLYFMLVLYEKKKEIHAVAIHI